jgi:hypothetical protein
MRVELTTWDDVITHLVDWMGGNPGQEARRDARRASIHALRELGNAHNWTYYYAKGRLTTVAPYATGTIQYDHTGGAYERLVTLTGGLWPDWAASGTLDIGNVNYEVYARIDSTRLQLSTNSNPGADISTDTAFTIFRDTYPLPSNFQAMGELQIATQSRILHPEHPSTWLSRQRIWRGTATPFSYAILGDPNFQNTLAIGFYPPPDNLYSMDYLYKRRPRQLRLDAYSAGTVTATASQTTIAGSGTAFTSLMAGSVIRLGTRTAVPTARWGGSPAQEERVVISVDSDTALTVDYPWTNSYSAVKYLISDPVDVEVGSMLTALLRKAELETGHARNKRDREQLEQVYQRALIQAREADARNFKEERVGDNRIWPLRLRDFPLGQDVS